MSEKPMTGSLAASDPSLLDTTAVHGLLAHRYPFLLVDRISVMERARRVVGIKRVSAGEWWCVGADPARPGSLVMPFGLVIEALAQASGALVRDRSHRMREVDVRRHVDGAERELHAGGATLCMVTHDLGHAKLATRAVSLFDGRVVEDDTGSALG